MSYDLMVFNKEVAPNNSDDFIKWYYIQTEWNEGLDYNEPQNASIELQNWFRDIIKTFPPLNGPLASNDFDNNYASDFSISKNIIYVAFSWSVAEEAYKTMYELAEKHGVGFFNVSSDSSEIFIPIEGKLKSIDNLYKNNQIGKNKPWWKFW
jgi:hypothetical protein